MSDDRHPPVLPPSKPNPERRLEEWRIKADESIQEAMQEGLFDNLPGAGKPIQWDTHSDGEDWLANHMLKNAGYVPAWIEDAKAIDEERAAVMAELKRLRTDSAPSAKRVAGWRERAEKLNRQVDRFNLSVPTERLQVRRVDVDGLADTIVRS
jgi:hypothetical protein